MNVLHKILYSVSGIIPSGLLNRVSPQPLILPYHHCVSDDYLPHIRGLYRFKTPQQFGKDLDWLLRTRIPIHPDDLHEAYFSGRSLSRHFLLTFDDGFREVHDIIAPILRKKGVPALFFINPAFTDNQELFYRCKVSLIAEYLKQHPGRAKELKHLPGDPDEPVAERIRKIHYPDRFRADQAGEILGLDFDDYLRRVQPFLTSSQIRNMADEGFTFGAHSYDHPHYGVLTLKEQLDQTIESLREVAAVSGQAARFFSFPHEDRCVRQRFFDDFQEVYPEKILFFGTQNQALEPRNPILHRMNAEDPSVRLKNKSNAVQLFRWFQPAADAREEEPVVTKIPAGTFSPA